MEAEAVFSEALLALAFICTNCSACGFCTAAAVGERMKLDMAMRTRHRAMLTNETAGICRNLRRAGRRAHKERGNGVLQKGKLLPLSAAVTGAASYQCATDDLSTGHVQLVIAD